MSTEPVVENYQYWWIEQLHVTALEPSTGVISLRAVFRLCRVDGDGIWYCHPTHPPQILNIPDVGAVAAENMSIAVGMSNFIDLVAAEARQAGIIR